MKEATFGSFKKCLELDVKNQWRSDITNKIGTYRNISINSGVDFFQKKNYQNAYESFKIAVEMYSVLSLTDTLAMINAALSAEKMKNYDEAFNYYKMCANHNYGVGAEMYQSMIRVLNASEVKDEERILNIIAEGKKRFPNDYVLNVEEFNYWYTKGNNDKAQLALQKAIEANPTNKILHFNIGVTYDNISNKYHDENKHEVAFQYMNKAIQGYTNAIVIDDNYVDAYYNLGALYYNQSITLKSVAGDYSGDKYESEMKKADNMLRKAIPLLEKVLSLSPTDKSTLTVLKSLYFNLDDMANYNRIKKAIDNPGTQVEIATTKQNDINTVNNNSSSEGSNKTLSELYKICKKSVFLIYNQDEENISQGTGFLVSSDGIAISNYHVFEGNLMGKEVLIMDDKRRFKIDYVIEKNKNLDYIIFKIKSSDNFSSLHVTSVLPEIGNDVFTIGNPSGLSQTLSTGIISSYRDKDGLIQTTTEITHGSSGGPLMNMKGEVIGITSSGLGVANLNFAVNISLLRLRRDFSNVKETPKY
jgi:serine protease Do